MRLCRHLQIFKGDIPEFCHQSRHGLRQRNTPFGGAAVALRTLNDDPEESAETSGEIADPQFCAEARVALEPDSSSVAIQFDGCGLFRKRFALVVHTLDQNRDLKE